jgi:hypothetical protein
LDTYSYIFSASGIEDRRWTLRSQKKIETLHNAVATP